MDKGQRKDSPPLQGRGRGWGLSVERIDELHNRAQAMRGQPTEPEKRLWRHLSRSQLGGFKFRRQAVIGSAMVDFLCASKSLVVEVDGWMHDDASADQQRDAKLAALGYRLMRFTNTDAIENIEGVLARILETLRQLPDRWDSPHPSPSPEEEGPSAAEARNSQNA